MCTTCGCGTTETHEHIHADGQRHHHTHELNLPQHRHDHNHNTKVIAIERDILAKNDRLAAANRSIFDEEGIIDGFTRLHDLRINRLNKRDTGADHGDQSRIIIRNRIIVRRVPNDYCNIEGGFINHHIFNKNRHILSYTKSCEG